MLKQILKSNAAIAIVGGNHAEHMKKAGVPVERMPRVLADVGGKIMEWGNFFFYPFLMYDITVRQRPVIEEMREMYREHLSQAKT